MINQVSKKVGDKFSVYRLIDKSTDCCSSMFYTLFKTDFKSWTFFVISLIKILDETDESACVGYTLSSQCFRGFSLIPSEINASRGSGVKTQLRQFMWRRIGQHLLKARKLSSGEEIPSRVTSLSQLLLWKQTILDHPDHPRLYLRQNYMCGSGDTAHAPLFVRSHECFEVAFNLNRTGFCDVNKNRTEPGYNDKSGQ